MAAADTTAEAAAAPSTRPQLPDEKAYEKSLAKAEAEYKESLDKLVRLLSFLVAPMARNAL